MSRLWLIFILLSCAVICSAKEYEDTLWTTTNDRIILKYDIKYTNEGVNINLLSAKKKLNKKNSKKYDESDKVDVVFFDRIFAYNDMTFSCADFTPEAFMVPSSLKYSNSYYGYFFLQDKPLLSFERIGTDETKISIPLYLSYYIGKGKRKLFSVCNEFNIPIKGVAAVPVVATKKIISDTIVSMVQIESDNELITTVLEQIKTVNRHLEIQNRLPFSDKMKYEIMYLRDLQKKVKDIQLKRKIDECLLSCELKQQELEEEEKEKAEQIEKSAQLKFEQEQARNDSIAAVQQKQVEAEKKRNIWMIIGGAILAILCFVGNIVFQHFRNISNQRNMMEIQQNIAQRAEYEAKRQTRNYVRNKTNEMVNNARRTAQQTVRNKVQQKGGNKPKNISI